MDSLRVLFRMQTWSPQLTLGLSLKDDARFSNFYDAKNKEIVDALKKMASGGQEKVIYLCGARGQGLSHLLQASCHHAEKYQLTSVYLPLANLLTLSPEILIGLESLNLICLDDMDALV